MISFAPTTRWDSKSTLLAHLGGRGLATALIGAGAEAPSRFFTFSAGCGEAAIEVGVISSGHGIDPAAVVFGSRRRVLVGHDRSLTWLNVDPLTIDLSRRLPGVFFEFLPTDTDEEVVVLHELGALRVNAGGDLSWSIDTDVVEDARIDASGRLELSTMDGKRLAVSLRSGEVSD